MLILIRSWLRQTAAILTPGFVAGVLLVGGADQLAAQETASAWFAQVNQENQDPDPLEQPLIQPAERPQPSSQEQQELPIISSVDEPAPIMDLGFPMFDYSLNRPPDESLTLFKKRFNTNYPGTFQDRLAMWPAANIRYQPLYLEDVGLERYGYHCGDVFQPWVSAVHFGLSTTLLVPNALLCEAPGNCTYPLGFCRPGSLAPQTCNRWLYFQH